MKLVYARWYALPDLPFRVLAYMALVSMDADPKPSYWGGWEPLALAAGRLVPERTDDGDVMRVRRAALKAVTSALKVLMDRGAVRVKTAAAPGRNATYELSFAYGSVHAHRAPTRGVDDPNGARLPDTTVHAQPTNGARSPTPTVHGERAPEEYEEQLRTQPRNESADLDLTVTGPRAHEAAEDPDFSDEVVAPLLRLVTEPAAPHIIGARRWSTRGQDTIAEAMARTAARRAAHQANGETA